MSILNPIPRARFSHTILDDILFFISSVFSRHEDTEVISSENLFASYIGRKGCVGFSLARTGLLYTLKALNAKPGDRIIMPPITIKAMLDIVVHLGLEPIFVDLDPTTAFFDNEILSKKVNELRPKFCLITYLFGAAPDIQETMQILENHEVQVIEDFSQGLNLGATEPWSGRIGIASIYSASAIKTLDTYGGGLVLSDNETFLLKLREFQKFLKPTPRLSVIKKIATGLMKNIIARPPVFSLLTFNLIKTLTILGNESMDRFVGRRARTPISEIPEEWLFKYSAIQARALKTYLPRVKQNDTKRIRHAREVLSAVKDLKFVSGRIIEQSVYWQLILISDRTKELRLFLQRRSIDTAFTSLILLPDLEEYGIQNNCPNATNIYRNGIYLPCYSELKKEQTRRIIEALNNFKSV